MDAVLLSVLPVLASWQAFSTLGWTAGWPGMILVGVIAFLLSLFVTVSYQLGFPEYRQPGGSVGPTIGNGVMSLGYLLTNNPLTAIISHMAILQKIMKQTHTAANLPGAAKISNVSYNCFGEENCSYCQL